MIRLLQSYRLLLISLMSASLAACGSPKLVAPEGDGESLVYGYIDMDEAPTRLDWVSMKRMRPLTKTPYYNFWVVDGVFFRGSVQPGVYKFDQFGGHSGWKNLNASYAFPSQGKGELDREITQPGLYFVGAYSYKKVKTGFFEAGKFDLVSSNKPTEREILQKILPYAKHEHWKDMIEKRLREMPR